MAEIFAEISMELDRVKEQMKRTNDPAMLESLRKDEAVLRDEYRHEVRAYYGLE